MLWYIYNVNVIRLFGFYNENNMPLVYKYVGYGANDVIKHITKK